MDIKNNTFKFISTVLIAKERRNEFVGYVCNICIGTGTLEGKANTLDGKSER
jgi:hypothetical protein